MSNIMKFEHVDFKALVTKNNLDKSLNFRSKIVDELNHEFTEDEKRWCVGNLYMYLNYHQTDEYPIDLENIYKLIGFSNKGNAKSTLINNFIENVDYKISLLPREQRSHIKGGKAVCTYAKADINDTENLATPYGEAKNEENLDWSEHESTSEVFLPRNKNLGGRPKETIMLNVDTFKNLCMLTKTEKAKEIRMYYVKLENMFNKLLKEEMEENKKLLREHTEEIEKNKKQLEESEYNRLLLQQENNEKQHKLEILTKKTNKYELGDSVYIFHSTTEDNKDVYKIGKTKNLNVRERAHKTASFKGVLLQVKCVDSTLLERSVHFLLDKYRIVSNREWFDVSFTTMKNAIYYAKLVLETNINFEVDELIKKTQLFAEDIKVKPKKNKNKNKIVQKYTTNTPEFEILSQTVVDTLENTKNKTNEILQEEHDELHEDIVEQKKDDDLDKNMDIFTQITYKPKILTDYQSFLNECCDVNLKDSTFVISYTILKNVYKIWSKKATHTCLKDMINFFKERFTTVMLKHNPLVSTSKYTHHFKGVSIKKCLYNFEKPDNNNLIIENFLYERCIRSPNYRVTMQDLFTDFSDFYTKQHENGVMTYTIKEKIKNYLDVHFVRLRSGESNMERDVRLSGWVGFALKTSDNPEPILKYKPKNAKCIDQVNVLTNEIFKKWSSVTDLAGYLKKSRTVTSQIVKRYDQIDIDGTIYIFNEAIG